MHSEIYIALLDSIGMTVLIEQDDGSFQCLTALPDRFAKCQAGHSGALPNQATVLVESLSPFLAYFLDDARAFWSKERAGCMDSGIWLESEGVAQESAWRAAAVYCHGHHVLLLQSASRDYEHWERLVRGAHALSLDNERLRQEKSRA